MCYFTLKTKMKGNQKCNISDVETVRDKIFINDISWNICIYEKL